MERYQQRYSVLPPTQVYINKYKNENNYSSIGNALDQIVKEHEEMKLEIENIRRLQNDNDKVRKAMNSISRDVKILLEFANSASLPLEIEGVEEIETSWLESAKEKVITDISKQRQNYLFKN